MLKIKKIAYFRDYKLKILFSDGKTKVVDFEKWIFESKRNVYLEPLKDIDYFKKVDLDESKYSICWPNGADFSPDALYEIGQVVKVKRTNLTLKEAKPHKKNKSSKSVRKQINKKS